MRADSAADPRYAGRQILTGPLWPLGSRAGFAQLAFDDAVARTLDWRAQGGRAGRVLRLEASGLLTHLVRLAPLQAPWRRELLVETHGPWTAYFNNDSRGGDPGPWVERVAREARCRGVVATHIPEDQYPFAITSFELHGPRRRSVLAGVHHGRWGFEAQGEAQPFEETATYSARLERNRFTRAMLLRYLAALGIDADRPSFYARGVLIASGIRDRSALDLVTARSRYAYDRRL